MRLLARSGKDVRSDKEENERALLKNFMTRCETTYYPIEREGRAATALLLADCESWPPTAEDLPTVSRIQAKLHELWLQEEDWHGNFLNLLAAACLKNPERSATLLRYLRPLR